MFDLRKTHSMRQSLIGGNSEEGENKGRENLTMFFGKYDARYSHRMMMSCYKVSRCRVFISQGLVPNVRAIVSLLRGRMVISPLILPDPKPS